MPTWFIDQVLGRQILKTEAPDKHLTGLKHRVANWCRAHVSRNGHDAWSIDLFDAHAKAASQDAPRKFRHALRQIVNQNDIAGYDLALERNGTRDRLVARCVSPGGQNYIQIAGLDAVEDEPAEAARHPGIIDIAALCGDGN